MRDFVFLKKPSWPTTEKSYISLSFRFPHFCWKAQSIRRPSLMNSHCYYFFKSEYFFDFQNYIVAIRWLSGHYLIPSSKSICMIPHLWEIFSLNNSKILTSCSPRRATLIPNFHSNVVSYCILEGEKKRITYSFFHYKFILRLL